MSLWSLQTQPQLHFRVCLLIAEPYCGDRSFDYSSTRLSSREWLLQVDDAFLFSCQSTCCIFNAAS